MLSESLSGIATIRANDALTYFQGKFRLVHDAHGVYTDITSLHFFFQKGQLKSVHFTIFFRSGLLCFHLM